MAQGLSLSQVVSDCIAGSSIGRGVIRLALSSRLGGLQMVWTSTGMPRLDLLLL